MSARQEVVKKIDACLFYKKYIPSLRVNGGTEANGLCPFHNDVEPSLSINLDKKVWHCHAGCGGGSLFDFYMKLNGVGFKTALKEIGEMYGCAEVVTKATKHSTNTIGRKLVITTLTDRAETYLTGRGIQKETAEKHGLKSVKLNERGGIGFEHLPGIYKVRHVYDEKSPPWIWSEKLNGKSPPLFGDPSPQQVVVTGGEWDALVLNQNGIPAVTGTAGEGTWKSEWNKALAGKDVVIIYDIDEKGKAGALKVARELQPHVKSIKIVNLSKAGVELSAKGDINEYFINDGTTKNMRSLIDSTPFYDIEKEKAWPQPVPLDTARLPEFPTEIFTGWLGNIFKAVSESTETPPELSAMIGLAVIATCCQKKYVVQVKDGYIEPSNIWTVAALASGNRKTAVLQTLTRPLLDWEREKAESARQEIKRAESERKTLEARLQSLRGQAAKAKLDEFETLNREIIALEETLPDIPTMPRLWGQDITPEKCGAMMADQCEKLSILSDEGGMFDLLAGRYNGGIPNLDLFLQAHAGAPVRVDRGSRPPVHMQCPALSIGLSPQPEVLRGLGDKPGFRGRGLLARFLYTLPASQLGYRSLDTEPVPASVTNSYQRGINALLEIQVTEDDKGETVPHILRLSQPAFNEWQDFSHVVERDMRESGRFAHITDWAGKLPGAAARIAGLLHCVDHAHGKPHEVKIKHETMERALMLAAVLSEHALAAFDLIGADPSLDGARRVWRWILRGRETSFTGRDCFNALKGHFKRVAHLEPALEILIERNYIFPIEDETPRGRGRPSRDFMTNPILAKVWK